MHADYFFALGRDEPIGPGDGRSHPIPYSPDPAGRPAYPAALARELELTRSNVSNHLTCLRDCGIVVAEPQGRKTRYEIVDAHLVQALNSLLDTTLAADENAPCIDSACDVPGCATGEGSR